MFEINSKSLILDFFFFRFFFFVYFFPQKNQDQNLSYNYDLIFCRKIQMRHFCEIFKLCELAEAILISKTCISMSRSLKTLSMQNFKTWLFSKMPCASHTGTKVEFLSKNSVMVKTHFSQIYEIILKLKIQKSRFNFKLINFSLIFDPN